MTEEWLIDGYNLLHDCADLRPKITRSQLLDRLAEFASESDRLVCMVLDGQGNDHEFRAHQTAQFHAVYSQNISADAYIEKYVCANARARRIMVVTNDRAIASMARGSGASVVSGAEFRRLLGESGKSRADQLFSHRVKAHGFNRPFSDKLKDKP